MDADAIEVAKTIELHEARVWAACVAATAATAGNPLLAEVDASGATPLCTLAALNFGIFNRVIALGVQTPATESEVDSLVEFFKSRMQTRFLVEVTPVSQPPALRDALIRRGIVLTGERVAKLWRGVDSIPARPPGIDVVKLSHGDREGLLEVSLRAWAMPKFFGPWFEATLGRDGFHHYGVFADGRLVSSGAMYVSDDVAWTGFGATLPEYRGRGFQTARLVTLLHEAAAMGCRIVHNETDVGTPGSPNTSFRNLSKSGFELIYEKEMYGPTESMN